MRSKLTILAARSGIDCLFAAMEVAGRVLHHPLGQAAAVACVGPAVVTYLIVDRLLVAATGRGL
jgi:hypothetical protein